MHKLDILSVVSVYHIVKKEGKVMKKLRRARRLLSLFICIGICITLFSIGGGVSAESANPADKIDPILLEKMENASDAEMFDVMLWLTDIDDTNVMEEAQARTQAKTLLYNDKAATAALNGKQMEAVDETQIYIEEKRTIYAEEYSEANQKKFNDIFPAKRWKLFSQVEQMQPTVIYSCIYAPAIKLKLNKSQILTAAQNSQVEMVYDDDVHFENAILPEDSIQPMNSSIISSASAWQGATNAALVRDSYGLSGSGVRIGQIETSALDLDRQEFKQYSAPFLTHWLSGTIVADPNAVSRPDGAAHAARVASIMIGEEANGVKGIARGASLYTSSTNRKDGSGYQGGYEWLLSKGVNIINMSASLWYDGIAASSYSGVSRWLDHIAIQHDVTLVVASSNDSLANTVKQSGMSYNAITVGALDDKATANRNDDERASFSSYANGSIVSKPDICAPGDNLNMAIPGNSYNERSGTSYATPQVTAIIAQMLQMRPEIKAKQAVIKSIVLAGVSSWKGMTSTPAGTNTRAMNPQTGAGEVDSKAMRYIAQAQRYVGTTLTSGVNTYTRTFNVPASDTLSRVALTWLRNARVSDHMKEPGTNAGCAKLKLEVTAPGGQVYTSYVAKENCQLVSFTPPKSGTYTVKVTVMERPSDEPNIHIGLAFY